MRLVIQRSREAKVTVDGEVKGSIDKGFVILVGVTHDDTEKDAKISCREGRQSQGV